MKRQALLYAARAMGFLVILLLCVSGPYQFPSLWFTADQQGDRLMREQKFAEAAKVYSDSMRQGVAFYQAGDFKSAASAFARNATPDAVYNQATSLVMMGKYDEAVKTFDRALALRPKWKEAEDNRAIAVVRRNRMRTTGGDETGGQMKADEIVYEKGANKSGESVQVNDGPPLSGADLQALWLRRVQTKPADFLRAKFAFQSAQQAPGGKP